ncbi:cytochrome b561 and DOMON domain-containing protein At3g25290-like [Impatiens glandulifera]|uniref:cytochrome b561 and DOMON domain-containing protein At3g25290-like n=1 Tax=Impatiens glandulifera TaxID=253017 RepID=UPI001FB0B121|nr:cytochrome b561 and DOMON domain-containing protein At3g25290-like [Impatiens glandulifera]
MASFSLSTIYIVLLLSLVSLSPALSSKCNTQKFSHKRVYDNCVDLPKLRANLHWTYINSSVSIAFIAPPASPDGWISWAINPTGKGMEGSQALIAFKDPKLSSMIVQTFNISSDSIQPSKIAFNVSNMSAEKSGKHMKIFATVFLPANMTTINQVWQVGSAVDSNGIPQPHAMSPANLNSVGELNLLGDDSISPAPQPSESSPAPAPIGKKNGGVSMMKMKIGNGFLIVMLIVSSIFLIVI